MVVRVVTFGQYRPGQAPIPPQVQDPPLGPPRPQGPARGAGIEPPIYEFPPAPVENVPIPPPPSSASISPSEVGSEPSDVEAIAPSEAQVPPVITH